MRKVIVLLLLLSVVGAPCFARDYADILLERKYRDALDAGCKPIDSKSPAAAALWGLLPGGGSFYTGQTALGIIDFLTWPFSPFWDMPLGYKKAKQINKEETILYCKAVDD